MKVITKILTLLSIVFLFEACNKHQAHPNYVEISGKITNAKSSEIIIFGRGKSDQLKLNDDGTFKDTIVVKNGKQQIFLHKDGINSTAYFENGDDIYFTADAKDFNNTVKFELDNADYNNYLTEKDVLYKSELGFKKSWYRNSQEIFNRKVVALKTAFTQLLASYPNIPEKNVKSEELINASYIKRFSDKYNKEHSFAVSLKKGKQSPEFKDYENFDGTTTSLSDFKGKYVFIDVWATWCKPCKIQFPYLQAYEKKFHNKNITFVSISADAPKDHKKWKKMVKDLKLTGTQLMAPKSFESEFIKAYNINSIPRFILLDPEGKIVDFNVPKPSMTTEIEALFSSINM